MLRVVGVELDLNFSSLVGYGRLVGVGGDGTAAAAGRCRGIRRCNKGCCHWRCNRRRGNGCNWHGFWPHWWRCAAWRGYAEQPGYQFIFFESAMHNAVAQRHETVARDAMTGKRKGEFALTAGKFALPKNRGGTNGDAIDGGKRTRRRRP